MYDPGVSLLKILTLSSISHLPCILTIGNFDGLHVGHQVILKKLKEESVRYQLPSVILTFEPLPREKLIKNRQQIPTRLMRLREKIAVLKQLDIDYVCIAKFTAQFSQLTKDEFIQQVLLDKLAVKKIIVGADFQFGRRREGDFDYLNKVGQQRGFEVESVDDVIQNEGRRISSSWIRQCLANDDLQTAAQLLGRPYTMIGRVSHGKKLGRVLGFPTANIHLARAKTPVHGIYAVKIKGLGSSVLLGVANIGERPTVTKGMAGTRTLLEVFIFDFNDNIYGRELEVEFVAKIRNEQYYESLDLLRAQIERDVIMAKEIFANLG